MRTTAAMPWATTASSTAISPITWLQSIQRSRPAATKHHAATSKDAMMVEIARPGYTSGSLVRGAPDCPGRGATA